MSIDDQIEKAWNRTYMVSGPFHAKNISLSGMSARDRFESGYRAAVADLAAKVDHTDLHNSQVYSIWGTDVWPHAIIPKATRPTLPNGTPIEGTERHYATLYGVPWEIAEKVWNFLMAEYATQEATEARLAVPMREELAELLVFLRGSNNVRLYMQAADTIERLARRVAELEAQKEAPRGE